jgi:hypothetical protein
VPENDRNWALHHSPHSHAAISDDPSTGRLPDLPMSERGQVSIRHSIVSLDAGAKHLVQPS